MKILIAEDESIIRLDLRESLEAAGFEVVADVSNGADAINKAELLNPDVVLLDVKMPVMDGITAASQLIKQGFCCILVTAFSSAEIVTRATNIGIDGYIVKPWRQETLRPAIEIGYAQFQRRKKLISTVQNQIAELEEHKLIDRARAILISRYGLSESEAFKAMQRAAMDGRTAMIEIARTIIESN